MNKKLFEYLEYDGINTYEQYVTEAVLEDNNVLSLSDFAQQFKNIIVCLGYTINLTIATNNKIQLIKNSNILFSAENLTEFNLIFETFEWILDNE